ncbi:MAG: cell division protein FtsQ/DivIB, partial [Acetivibrio sp.]
MKDKRRRQMPIKHKNKLFLIVFPLFLIFILFFFLHNRIDTVEIKGCHIYSQEEIKKELIQGISDKNSILLYLKARYLGLKEIPYIEKVTVKRVNSHKVVLRVYEKSLIACVEYMSQYLYFDKDGVILDSSSEAIQGIPSVSGLNFSDFTIYEKLKVEETEIFEQILEISQIIKRYKLPIERIHFNERKEVSLVTSGIKIYLGKREFYDEPLAALSQVLPQTLKKNLKGSMNM